MIRSIGSGWRIVLVALALLPALVAGLPQVAVAAQTGANNALTQSIDGITFSFDPNSSEADRNDTVEGTLLGQEVIGGFVGMEGLNGARITVSAVASDRSPYIMASTRGQEIEVYAGSPSWQDAPSLIRIETLVHELMHVYQNALEQHTSAPVPLWFDEGTAEALGYLAISRLGVVDQDDIYALNQYLLTRYPYDGSLAGLQAYDSMDADSYPLAYIAVQYLLGRAGMSVSALTQVYQQLGSGQSFTTAFQTVFGQSANDFYVEFDAWRTGLVQVSTVPSEFKTPAYSGAPATATWEQI